MRRATNSGKPPARVSLKPFLRFLTVERFRPLRRATVGAAPGPRQPFGKGWTESFSSVIFQYFREERFFEYQKMKQPRYSSVSSSVFSFAAARMELNRPL